MKSNYVKRTQKDYTMQLKFQIVRVIKQVYELLYQIILERATQYKKITRLDFRKYLLNNDFIINQEWQTIIRLQLQGEMIEKKAKERSCLRMFFSSSSKNQNKC